MGVIREPEASLLPVVNTGYLQRKRDHRGRGGRRRGPRDLNFNAKQLGNSQGRPSAALLPVPPLATIRCAVRPHWPEAQSHPHEQQSLLSQLLTFLSSKRMERLTVARGSSTGFFVFGGFQVKP